MQRLTAEAARRGTRAFALAQAGQLSLLRKQEPHNVATMCGEFGRRSQNISERQEEIIAGSEAGPTEAWTGPCPAQAPAGPADASVPSLAGHGHAQVWTLGA